MATATLNTPAVEAGATLRERVVDTARRMAHLSHEARLFKSVASDAVDSGAYQARRAVTRARRGLDDARDEVAHRIKRAPMTAVGTAFGAGVCIAAATGALAWMMARRSHA